MNYRIRGLAYEPFAALFALSDDELAQRRIVRRRVDSAHGFPCRVSLTDAQVGDEVLLLPFLYHDVSTPFRGEYAIYVREGEQQFDAVNVIPDQLARRVLSLRAFDEHGMMVGCRVVDGRELAPALTSMLDDAAVSYTHIHFAAAGCYAAQATRA